MRWSHLISAVVGGLVVAGALVAFGLAGPRQTTIVPEPQAAAQGGISGLTSLNDLYQTDTPAVVLVTAKILQPGQVRFRPRPDTDRVSTGSGFLADRLGDILTAYSVVAGADPAGGVTVTFENDQPTSATVIDVDARDNLAVLRVNHSRLPPVAPLKLDYTTSVRVGDPTLALGSPLGLDPILTQGDVAALQHQIVTRGGRIDNVIQVNQPRVAGNEGGPLISGLNDQVIGVNSEVDAIVGGGSAVETVSLGIPIDLAAGMLRQVSHQTRISVAYLGVGRASAKPSKAGAAVQVVYPNGPAAQAGIKPGATIVQVDGIPVDSISDVDAEVSTLSPGKKVALSVRENGHLRTVLVTLASQNVALGSR